MGALTLVLMCLTASGAARPPSSGALSAALRAGLSAGSGRAQWALDRPVPGDEQGPVVVVEVDGDAWAWAPVLEDMGAEVRVLAEGRLQLWCPWEALTSIATLPGVRAVREPHLARAKEESEGVADTFLAEDWREAGLHGRGIRVVILDVGFSGWEDAVESGELPEDTRAEPAGDESTSSHGVAVAEIVSDYANEIRLLLVEFHTDVEYLAAVEIAGDWGAEVINASIGFDNLWPADGSSPYTLIADGAVEDGALWVSAAGNENERYRIGPMTDDDADGVVEIDGVEGTWVATVVGGLEVSLRWSEPMMDASVDVDLHAFETDGTPCGISEEAQDGQGSAPYEHLLSVCEGEWALVQVVWGGEDPETEQALREGSLDAYLYGYNGILPASATGMGNLTLPADTRLGLAVAACDRESGTAPDYSSRGPSEDGRPKPDLCGPTGVSTSAYGERSFEGTSASAPHVSGLAALVLGSVAADDPAETRSWLLSHAQDLGQEGPDLIFGEGAVSAEGAPRRDCGCATRQGRPPWLGLLLSLAGLRRRLRRDNARCSLPLASRPAHTPMPCGSSPKPC